MKHTLLLFLVLIAFVACEPKRRPIEPPSTTFGPFKIKRGTNIAHWLSQSERRGEERKAFFTKRDIVLIDSLGFDHIRLPVDEEQLWDEGGKPNREAFDLLEQALTWCSDVGMRVVLDLHILRSHYFNADIKPLWTDVREQDKLISLWRNLSESLRKWPNGMLAYEFMNEPVADDAEQWNQLLMRVADSLRSWEPQRTLVIGSNRWQSANTFDELRVPANDPNIILSFHFYEPFHLTHYQASWTRLKDFKGEVNYPGRIVKNGTTPEEQRIFNSDTLRKMMMKPLQVAARLKLPLYCGEFGVIDKAPMQPKMAWYRDMVELFERYGVAYANWNYKSGSFGIVDDKMKLDNELIGILTGKDSKK